MCHAVMIQVHDHLDHLVLGSEPIRARCLWLFIHPDTCGGWFLPRQRSFSILVEIIDVGNQKEFWTVDANDTDNRLTSTMLLIRFAQGET